MKKTKVFYMIIFTLVSVFLFLNKNNLTYKPWISKQPLEWLGSASGNGRVTAIIADSAKTIVVVNEEGELIYKLRSNHRDSRSFISAELVDLDEYNNLYVYDKNFGGLFEENTERILKYSPEGKFIKTLYSYSYKNEEFIITKGKISGITSTKGLLYLVRLENEGFYLESISTEQKTDPKIISFFAYPDAFFELSYCRINTKNERIVWTTKSGNILQYNFLGSLINEITVEDNTSPYMSVSDDDNNVIYTDIINGTIFSINTYTGKTNTLFSHPNSIENFYYYINYKNKIYASYNADNILILNNDGIFKTIDSYYYSKHDMLFRIGIFLICLIYLVLCMMIFIKFIIFLSKKRTSDTFKRIILVGMCIIFGAGISSFLIIHKMQKQYNENTYNGMENISRIITASIDIDTISSIQSPAEFDSREYRILSKHIKDIFLKLQFEGKQVYLNIWMEQKGFIYSMYDLEGALGTFYPYGKYKNSFLESIYNSKKYDYSNVHTSSGTWASVTGPIFNKSGNAIAAIEIGYNIRMVEKQNRTMIIQTSFFVLATTIAFILIVIEFILIIDAYKRNKAEITGNKKIVLKSDMLKNFASLLFNVYKKNKGEDKPIQLPPRLYKTIIYYLVNSHKNSNDISFKPELIRASIFLMYFSANFATALLPVYAAGLYIPFFNLPKEFIITLPFTAQTFFVVISFFVIPNILEKAGIKRIILISAIIFFLGNIFCFIAVNIIYLSIGYALIGFSGGTFVLICNTIIGSQKRTEDVNSGFAHFNASYLAGVNVGIVFGSMVAQFFPYRIVFCFASGMSLVFLAIIIFSVRSKFVNHLYDVYPTDVPHGTEEGRRDVLAPIKFMLRPIVLCTLFLILMPYVISMGFTEYFMPVFGIENGLEESNIGQLILLSGLFAILFGTSLCEYVSKKFSMRIIIFFSILLDAGAVYLFSLHISISMLIFTIILLAIANIFALTNIQTYFTLLYQGKNISSIKALSIYSSVENISMAAGPIMFSYLLNHDISYGMKLFAGTMFGCLIIFMIVSGLSQKEKKP